MTTFRARVKPLVWRQGFSGYPKAAGVYRNYSITKGPASLHAWFGGDSVGAGYSDHAEAEAACQRDHDARVRALLIIEDDHDTDR